MIKKYWREYGVWYGIYFFLSINFLLIFYLYHLPFSYFQASFIFNLTLLFLVTLYFYWKFYQKCKDLHHFIYVKEVEAIKKYTLPSDDAYQAIIQQTLQEHSSAIHSYKLKDKHYQDLIKMWAHQMKVPISAISLMAQTEQLDKKEVQEQLLRLENDIARLLNYIKFSQNHSDFLFEKCRIRSLFIDLIKKNKTFFLKKDLSVTIDGDWEIISDKKWLSFVFSQILDNAIKYNKKGGHIIITVKEGRILIEDTGIGILKEDIPRLFEEGFTGYNGHEHQKATGFGLYMVKKILNNLELDIKIESQIDKGTKVIIEKEE
ncbi:sensor histidine kinase [Streptococcus macacae]|uniref:histidine kinase n=1 Tax=Streptococcus macacae NCTC 11558 TaxID=764298 RepID=G5JU94_9STRE|nr:sensor histidine kinase [Streptococcus macacae]EHJ52015.1 ATPase/histidine kinase/DNA gyrase B/HSP90 domain protein [Streptococcus macacae NCTC 11558]SUN78457.1 histidine kinase [Streptococcus macacae NCTC 11558]